jgi:hypothetical protein
MIKQIFHYFDEIGLNKVEPEDKEHEYFDTKKN